MNMNIVYRQLGFAIFWFSLVFLPIVVAHIHGEGWPGSKGCAGAFILFFIFFSSTYPVASHFYVMHLNRKFFKKRVY